MENNNQMVQVFNKAIADSGIQIYLYRDDMYCEWKADVDTSVHDKQIRAETIDEFLKQFIDLLLKGNVDIEDIRNLAEQLKEQK